MAEKSFDALLRQALLDAAWQELTPAWETESPTFSPAYLRWRTRLLADPFAWAKKHLRPLWARALRTAACILLAASLTLGSLMAVSPTVRAAVLNWLREISGGNIFYSGTVQQSYPDEPPAWRPTWLPDGWNLNGLMLTGTENSSCTWTYQGGQGHKLRFQCWWSQAALVGVSYGESVDAEAIHSQATVWEEPADFYELEEDGEYSCNLLWQSETGMLFHLSGDFLKKSDMERIADSTKEIEDISLPECQMKWVPETCIASEREQVKDVIKEIWTTEDRRSVEWICAAESAGELAKPTGMPEVVHIADLIGRYWGATASEAASGVTVTVGGSETEYLVSDEAHENTLLWKDPATGMTFRLHGALDKETLLRMAESVVQTAPESSAHPAGG